MSDTVVHTFQSAKGDVGDASLVRPSNWNAEHKVGIILMNHSGSQQLVNAACVVDQTQDDSFTTSTTQGDKRPVVIVQQTINNGSTGLVKTVGHVVVNVQNAVARGDLLRVSSTAGALESAGQNPEHSVGFATTAFAGPGNGTVEAVLFGHTRRTQAGVMQMYGSTSTPFGWLLCDGTAVSRTTYADLFAVIGTSFGAGDGSSTFNLPNFKSRMPIGVDSGDVNMDTIGEQGGSKTKTLSVANLPAHHHTVPSSQHNHGYSYSVLGGGGDFPVSTGLTLTSTSSTTDLGTVAAQDTQDTGSGTAHDVMNPYLAVNFIIKW